MPRKQNGFGTSKSFAAKDFGRIDRVESLGRGSGSYPRDRRFGSTVTRSVIEEYDLNSDWVKWRKGLEFYYRAAWYELEQRNPDFDPFDPDSEQYIPLEIISKLYQGRGVEFPVKFSGYRFATSNSDTANHYVVKREPINPTSLGVINEVLNDPIANADKKELGEIWTRGIPNDNSFMLRNMIGERLTDGVTEASLSYLLTENDRPAIYIGVADPQELTQVKVTVSKAELLATDFIQNNDNDLSALIGEIGYIPEGLLQLELDPSFTFRDNQVDLSFQDLQDYFTVEADLSRDNAIFEVLDNESDLPPSLLDIGKMPKLFSTTNATYQVTGNFYYQKKRYQRFFGRQYLTAEVVESEVNTASFTLFPFLIQSIKEVGADVEITSIEFPGELVLYAPIGDRATLVFTDYSFTKTTLDLDAEGNYYHEDKRDENGDPLLPWLLLDTDVDPWMDEVFTTGQGIVPAVVYACSCPSHSHSQLRMPQSTESQGTRAVNRQRRYPIPTAQSPDRFTEGALAQRAGEIASWSTRRHRMGYKQCKHSIAARFIDRIKTKEPNSYPSVGTRIKFEEKLKKEIDDVGGEFQESYERGGITLIEIIFAMAIALNMDNTELADVILKTKF